MPSGHVRKRGKLYQVILELDRHPQTQERRFKYVSGFQTKRAATQERDRLVSSLRSGTYQEPTTLTLAGFVEQWLSSYARVSLTPWTAARYELALRDHILPHLGDIPLSKIAPLHIQEWVAGQLTAGRKDGKGGLSARTVRWNLRLLRAVLRRAVLWGVIARNPADSVEGPPGSTPEPKVLTEAQAGTLLATVAGTRLYIPVLIALATGMRRGEVLALEWGAVDLDGGSLRVVASVSWEKGCGYVYRAPKTASGRRAITLPAGLVVELRRHRGAQVERALAEGREPPSFVCAEPDGSLISPNALATAFCQFLRDRGLPPIPFHALRHSHCSYLLQDSFSVKEVAQRLGHSDGGVLVLQVYSHVLPGRAERAAESIDRLLRDG